MSEADSAYAERLQREGKKWGDHLAVEAGQEMYAWLDHPSIRAHYEVRSRVEGQPWRRWLASYFHPVARASAVAQARALLIPLRAWRYFTRR